METLILRFRKKKNYYLVKELASLLEDQGSTYGAKTRKSTSSKGVKVTSRTSKTRIIRKDELSEQLPKSKFKSPEEFRTMGGILKGQLISKEHLRSISWKKRA